MKLRNISICGLLMIFTLIASLVAYPHLSPQVAIHWDWQGHVEAYGSRWILLLSAPLLMLCLILLFSLLPGIFQKRFDIGRFEATYFYIMLMLVALLGYVHFIVLWANTGGRLDVSRALVGGTAFFFLLIGNVMGKVRRNYWLGIRTPWTLASEQVWYATHRFAAKAMVVGALFTLILVFAGVPFAWCLSLLMLSIAMPVVYSYIYFVQLKRSHNAK